MGILKGCLKVVGTVALGATGVASKILGEVSDVAGFEIGSDLFGMAKDASLDGIRSMWNSESVDSNIDKIDSSSYGFVNRKLADTAKRAANIAKANGDTEKYNYYMEQYEKYK